MSNDDIVHCCWTVFLVSRQRVRTVCTLHTANLFTCWPCSYWKCLHLKVQLLLPMSTSVVPVPAANVLTWRYCKCLYVLVLFLLQMTTHVGPVPTANDYTCWSCSYWNVYTCGTVSTAQVYTCWSCSYCKWLHMLVLFLLQITSHVGPVPTANVLIFHLKLKIKKILLNSTVIPSAWCSIGYVLYFIIGIFL